MVNLKLEDMTGRTIGKWHVIRQSGNSKRGAAMWECRCECGNTGWVRGADLRNMKSTRCMKCKFIPKPKKIKQKDPRFHGGSGTRLHNIWMLMSARCRDVNNKDYGGRGISICEEWKSFVAFREWALNNGYSDDLTIDRIDVNKGYTKENCRWATAEVQSANRRNVHLAPDGEPWWHKARRNGVTRAAYEWRKANGWDWLKIVETPLNKRTVPYVRDGAGKFTK